MKRAAAWMACVLTATLWSASTLADPQPTSAPAGPRMELIQQVKNGADGVSQMAEIDGIQFNGDFVYVSGKKSITYFKRDAQTGKLAFAGDMALENNCNMAFAGGRLYAVGGKAMTWYDIEPQTGKPVEKGTVDCPACFQMVVGPDQKDLYLKPTGKAAASEKLVWFRIDADGKPAKAGEVAGKGIGGDAWMLPFTMTADGKYLYSMSARGDAIACIERKANGEIVYKKAIDLTPPAKPTEFKYPCLAVSPDGKWLYASLLSYDKPLNYYAIFKRDPQTGDLTCQETFFNGFGDDHKQIYGKFMTIVFLPDSSGGYWANCERPAVAFRLDPETGRMVWAGDFKDGRNVPALRMAFDTANGLLYTGNGTDLFVIRTAKFQASGKPAPGETTKPATK